MVRCQPKVMLIPRLGKSQYQAHPKVRVISRPGAMLTSGSWPRKGSFRGPQFSQSRRFSVDQVFFQGLSKEKRFSICQVYFKAQSLPRRPWVFKVCGFPMDRRVFLRSGVFHRSMVFQFSGVSQIQGSLQCHGARS